MSRTEGRIPPFQTFLEEHRAVVYRFLLASAGPQDADDCFQETFLSALKAYPRLRHSDNLRGWVLAIATRKAIDAGRARSRRPVPVEELPEVVRAGERGQQRNVRWNAGRAQAMHQQHGLVLAIAEAALQRFLRRARHERAGS